LREEYQKRLRARTEAVASHEAQSAKLSNWRLLMVVLALGLGWWKFALAPIGVAGFIALAVWHDRIARKIERERRGITLYDRALARLDGRWMGKGNAGERFLDPEHPYAADLDVFGRGSLFELISQARTLPGEATLASWLRAPSLPETIRRRQEAVRELQPGLDLRETLALIGEDIRAEVHPEALVRWADHPPVRFSPVVRFVASGFVAVTVVLITGFFLQAWTWHAPVMWLLLQGIFGFVLRDRVLAVISRVDLPAHDLRLVSAMLAEFEKEQFQTPRLIALRQELETDGKPASGQISELRTLVDRLDWTHNEFFKPVARTLLWTTHLAIGIERWRQQSGAKVAAWLSAIGELEALSSLANYAAEHPVDTWPEFADDGPVFQAQGLAHPLIPLDHAVRNDVTLDSGLRLLLVSGSNMSGKSTLLRSVGLATVLAWAGAPIRAAKLRLSPLSVGAAMRVQDSVQEGKSRFYAEILRLRQVVDLSKCDTPLLFLLDEILAGTNSHDRCIGAQAIVVNLVERGAIGLVTTHDLALAAIVEKVGEVGRNVHFEDHIEDGHIAFDYRMRPGVVTKSNAIELMRSVGLDV
jgi:hypothetical protein